VRFEDLDWLGIDGSINIFYLAFVWELDGWMGKGGVFGI